MRSYLATHVLPCIPVVLKGVCIFIMAKYAWNMAAFQFVYRVGGHQYVGSCSYKYRFYMLFRQVALL